MTTKCPHCFRDLPTDRFAYVCTGQCAPIPDTEYTRLRGIAMQTRPLTIVDRPAAAKRDWAAPAQVQCRRCGEPALDCCLTCHYQLPEGWRSGRATCIALAGARDTGKSNYIAVLVQALKDFATARKLPFSFVGARSREVYTTVYHDRLYVQRKIIPSTPLLSDANAPQFDPIILSIGQIKGAQRYIVLRDVAGEAMEANADPDHLTFFARASMVLFLFDPTAVPAVKVLLQTLVPMTGSGADPLLVLEHLNRLMRGGRPRLAVVVSKLDALWAIAELATTAGQSAQASDALVTSIGNLGAGFRHDLRAADRRAISDDLELVHEEVRSLLTMMHATALVNSIERGSSLEHRYFAVSALGHAPDSAGYSSHGIAPYRVLDPLLWHLMEEGEL